MTEIRDNSSKPIDISVIIPVHNEARSLQELWQELRKVLDSPSYTFEVIIVDDGSTDETQQILKTLLSTDSRLRSFRLRLCSGKSAAYTVGFKKSRGKTIITMDGDLQDDPGDIMKLLEKASQGFPVVCGWKTMGKGSFLRTFPSRIFNWMSRKLLGIRLHDMNCPLRLLSWQAAKELNLYGELYRFIPALLSQRGFAIAEIPVSNRARKYGGSNFGIERFLRGFWDLVSVVFLSGFREYPLHLFGAGGLIFFLSGFTIDAFLTIRGLFITGIIGHTALLLLGILFMLIGLLSVGIGLLGELIVSQYFKKAKDYPLED